MGQQSSHWKRLTDEQKEIVVSGYCRKNFTKDIDKNLQNNVVQFWGTSKNLTSKDIVPEETVKTLIEKDLIQFYVNN